MPRQTKLVTQYLERIARKALEEHRDVLKEFIRRRIGIYALYRRNKLYYAGLASSLHSRLKHHLDDRHGEKWDSFSVYLTIGDQHLRELESLLLRVVEPPGNVQLGRFAGAEDIRRKFGRAIAAKQRRDLDLLLGRPIDAKDEDKKASHSIHVRGRYKGRLYHAWLRHTGTVKRKGRVYSSASAAATAICKHPVNGRWFWHFERSPGDWVRIRDK